LGGEFVDDAGVGGGDSALAVDEEGDGHAFDGELLGDVVVAEDDGVVDLFFGEEGADGFPAVSVQGDADDGEATIFVFGLEFDEPGDLDLAAMAPSGPEIEKDDLALEGGELKGFAGGVEKGEVGSRLAVFFGGEIGTNWSWRGEGLPELDGTVDAAVGENARSGEG